MPSAVSFRYATALADTVESPGPGKPARDPQVIASQLAQFNALFNENHELRIVFSTPAVAAARKKAILAKLASELGLETVTANFLNVVIDHDRMGLVGEILEAYQSILNERLGIAVAQIASAHPLEEDEKQQLAGALSAKTGRQVTLNFSLDPRLIGGVVARIGSTVYDGSVRGYLDRLRAELVED
jgi:F-type H+-transporting ATPase subunit delta